MNAFFGNRSLVIHSSNTTRLTCANFTLLTAATSPSSGPSSTASVSASATGSSIPDSGSAYTKLVSGAAVLAGFLALILVLE